MSFMMSKDGYLGDDANPEMSPELSRLIAVQTRRNRCRFGFEIEPSIGDPRAPCRDVHRIRLPVSGLTVEESTDVDRSTV
jgi:hypothetical protein